MGVSSEDFTKVATSGSITLSRGGAVCLRATLGDGDTAMITMLPTRSIKRAGAPVMSITIWWGFTEEVVIDSTVLRSSDVAR